MPKHPTFPDCFDEVKQIAIADIKRVVRFRPEATVSASLSWTSAGAPSGSIGLTVSLSDYFVELDYLCNGKPVNYRVRLESIPVHFGGSNWYFICPSTGKRCSKLYGIGKYFLSRAAYPSAMYSKQTEAKNSRDILRLVKAVGQLEEFEQKPYARTVYDGQLTKRYMRMLNRAESASDRDPFRRFRRPN